MGTFKAKDEVIYLVTNEKATIIMPLSFGRGKMGYEIRIRGQSFLAEETELAVAVNTRGNSNKI